MESTEDPAFSFLSYFQGEDGNQNPIGIFLSRFPVIYFRTVPVNKGCFISLTFHDF